MIHLQQEQLRLQQQFASRLPPLNILSRALDILQRVDVMDPDVQPVLLDESPQLLGVLLELVAGGDVVVQRGAQQLDVLGRQATVFD